MSNEFDNMCLGYKVPEHKDLDLNDRGLCKQCAAAIDREIEVEGAHVSLLRLAKSTGNDVFAELADQVANLAERHAIDWKLSDVL